MTINFEIEHIDPVGQGVSKVTDKVTFITKTLPGEKGNAQVYAKKSKVQFAKPVEIHTKSPDRIDPDCPHFENCPSCHFLHTTYDKEISFKLNTLEKQVSKFLKVQSSEIFEYRSPVRSGYRNRVQLHYDKTSKNLGHFNRATKSIINVPHCIIANENVKQKVTELYLNNSWLKLLKNQPKRGHIEIFDNADNTNIEINKPYAFGGFTQVNIVMNQEAINIISKRFEVDFSKDDKHNILDIFGGKGNLSKELKNSSTNVVDISNFSSDLFEEHQNYVQQNLYDNDSLNQLQNHIGPKKIDLLILDPPRSGFKELVEYADNFSPKFIYYMSCQSDTALRDISLLKNYKLIETHLLDFFPSTYHFETVFILKKD